VLKSVCNRAALLAGAIVLSTAGASAAPVKTEHVTAELVAERSAVQPGESVRIGLRLQHAPHWHTYWRNPGDSGLPTTLRWTLPDGSQAGEIEWPAPKRLPIGPLVNYGYEGELLLPLRYTAPATARAGDTLTLRAHANWLVCKDICIPENATLQLRLPVIAASATPGGTEHALLFERSATEKAAPISGWVAQVQRAGRDLLLTIETKSAMAPGDLPPVHVFPYPEQVIAPAQHDAYRTPRGYAVKLALQEGASLPPVLSGIAVAQGEPALGAPMVWGGKHRSVEFDAPVRSVPAIVLPAGAQPLSGATPVTARVDTSLSHHAPSLGVLTALVLAFIGGMLLNLMPCVFPVLSIKLLALAQHAVHKRSLRSHALAYSGGVVLSFVALAGALLALRAMGSAVGWGFQLQEPAVVFALALLFFLIGLNLLGAVGLGHFVPQRLAAWRSQRPAADAFACGVLAVVAASPCTAPFMGAALGFAITQSEAVALAVFAALGAGMALPYALLVLMPGWRARLPRPGPWMVRLRQMLALPMFATVVWLLWVLAQQAGSDASTRALLALLGLVLLLWLTRLPRVRGVAAKAAGVALFVGVLAWSWPQAIPPSAHAQAPASQTSEGAWEPYDENVLAQRVAQGQAVFIDFTAAWCVSCQVNKRLVLHSDETLRAFAQSKVSLMRADWTNRDVRITDALARLGRNGVPVYVLIRPGREPLLLPEILTVRLVQEALATL
jgi:thiol:disulfide interchange protein/DsbC/DsbD-like thiol-disulfide interchange protein